MNTPGAVADPHRLARFIRAQTGVFERALGELRRGRKETHWMWFIFPQVAGLGSSTSAKDFAIQNLEEAAAFLAHPILGQRLIQCCQALLQTHGRTAREILGPPDDLKLRSCVTLFGRVPEAGPEFRQVLQKFYDDQEDPLTLGLLGITPEDAMGRS